MENWYAWREGMATWSLVEAVDELNLKPSAPPPVIKPKGKPSLVAAEAAPQNIPCRQDDHGQYAFDFGETEGRRSVPSVEIYWMNEGDELVRADIDDLAYMKKSDPAKATQAAAKSVEAPDYRDRRKYERHNVRLSVIIQSDNLMFRSFTKNISLGGIALETPVPSIFMGSECAMIVTEPVSGEKAHFTGRLLNHRDTARYLSFFRASPESIVKMQAWIAQYVKNNKKSA